ncbi:PGF-pre-PGF domain-containing protein [Candidatus Woesearchaeota archaeon]|nr:PGF-pre-PGF domain-containing protein [Candidatus Woesearchaeota archaeon]
MMKKEDYGISFNSQDGKVNIMLLFSIVLIFVFMLWTVEAVTISQVSPTNLSINGSRYINFTFTANWTGSGEVVTNCSIWTNVTSTWAESQQNTSTVGNIVNNTGAAGSLSWINFTLSGDGNFSWTAACRNTTDAASVYNFSQTNRTLLVDSLAPTLIFDTPKVGILADSTDNITSYATATFYVNVSDNSTRNVWMILNSVAFTHSTIAPTGANETTNRTLTFNGVISTPDMKQYRFNMSPILTFNSTFTSPGPHSVVFCANDSFTRITCTNRSDFIIKGMNVTQMEIMFSTMSQQTGAGDPLGPAFGGLNITFGNGTEIPDGTFMNPVDGITFGGITHKNFTFILNISKEVIVHIVAGRIDESQFANASNTKVNNTPTREIQQQVGTGFRAQMAWADIASFIPSEVSYQFGILQLGGTGYSKKMYCNGTTVNDPQCHSISQCNSSVFGIYNDTLAIPTNNACWLESGTINGQALSSGFTYIFADHFSGGLGGSDFSQVNVTFNGGLFNIFNTTTALQVINFTLEDINSTGLNLTKNNSIMVNLTLGTGQVAHFSFLNSTNTNLSCFTTDTTSLQNTTSVTCNVTYAFSNGTYIINVSAVDTSNNSNPVNSSTSSIVITIDNIPPVFVYYNLTTVQLNTTQPGETSLANGTQLGLGDFFSTAQVRRIFAIANWTDNLTYPLQGSFQAYNDSANGGVGAWVAINSSPSSYLAHKNSSWINLSFTIPSGHNMFEGRNVSFRVIANDTVGNVNTSARVKNFTVQVNDTTKPTLLVSSVGDVDAANITNVTDTTPTIVWNVTENNHLRYVAVQIDTLTDPNCNGFRNFTATANANRNGTLTLLDTGGCTPLSNGTHVVRLTSEDQWGNSELYLHNFSIQSASIPTLDFTFLSNGLSLVNKSNVTPYTTMNFSSLVPGIGTLKNISWTSSCNSSSNIFTNNTLIAPFNYSGCKGTAANKTVTVTVYDFAGNFNSSVFGFLVDDLAPSLAVTSPTNGFRGTSNISISLSAKDDSQRIDYFGYYLDNKFDIVTLNLSGNIEGAATNITILNITNFTPSTHTIIFTVNDTLGNAKNSSIITFTALGPINLISVGFNSTTTNTTLALYNVNISKVNLTNESGGTIENIRDVTDKTLNLFMALNMTNRGVNVTLTFNASAVNWDSYNFTVRQNNTGTYTHIFHNFTTAVFDMVWFNESIQDFIPNNNSYYASVKYPINASRDLGGTFEIWYFANTQDLTAKINVTECSGGFSPALSDSSLSESSPCWNNTNNQSIDIFLPHFSVLAFTNNTAAPTANVSFPTDIQTVSMFLPNITVSADAVTCKYQLNSSTPTNVTMTKTGTVCIGQTERFNNSNIGPSSYNITFWVIDDDSNTNQYIWGFNVSDTTPPNTPNSSRVSVSASTTTATVTISGMNETVNATVQIANGSSISPGMQTDFNETQAVSLSGLSASTQYHFNVTVCDFNGNCAVNSTGLTFTTSAAAAAATTTTTTSAGAAGGGAAAPSNVEASAARQWDSLEAGSSGVLTVNNEKIAVTGVIIDVKNAVTNPSITVESLTSNPLSVAAAAKVYQYLQLKKGNIADSDASKIAINFRVPKSWLTSNNVAESDIVLWRYTSGNWNKLETKLVSSDGSFANYEAITPGFSTFAIGNKEAGTSAFAIIDMIRDFYAGTSKLTAFDIIDQIRSFYGG